MPSPFPAQPVASIPVRPSWLATAARPDVVRRSLRVAVAVGTLLILINYGDRLLANELQRSDWIKMALTYLVPYGVSTYASVGALRSRAEGGAAPGLETRVESSAELTGQLTGQRTAETKRETRGNQTP